MDLSSLIFLAVLLPATMSPGPVADKLRALATEAGCAEPVVEIYAAKADRAFEVRVWCRAARKPQ